MTYCKLDPKEQNSSTFESNSSISIAKKCVSKYRLQNGGQFASAFMCSGQVCVYLDDHFNKLALWVWWSIELPSDSVCSKSGTPFTWWRHQMETFSALLAICTGNSPVPGEFLAQRPVTRSFDVFLDLRLNKRLSKQWWGWWFETLSCPLWRHRNDYRIYM